MSKLSELTKEEVEKQIQRYKNKIDNGEDIERSKKVLIKLQKRLEELNDPSGDSESIKKFTQKAFSELVEFRKKKIIPAVVASILLFLFYNKGFGDNFEFFIIFLVAIVLGFQKFFYKFNCPRCNKEADHGLVKICSECELPFTPVEYYKATGKPLLKGQQKPVTGIGLVKKFVIYIILFGAIIFVVAAAGAVIGKDADRQFAHNADVFKALENYDQNIVQFKMNKNELGPYKTNFPIMNVYYVTSKNSTKEVKDVLMMFSSLVDIMKEAAGEEKVLEARCIEQILDEKKINLCMPSVYFTNKERFEAANSKFGAFKAYLWNIFKGFSN